MMPQASEIAAAAIGACLTLAVGYALTVLRRHLDDRSAENTRRQARAIETAELVGAVKAEIASVHRRLDIITNSITLIGEKIDEHASMLGTQAKRIDELEQKLDAHAEDETVLLEDIHSRLAGATS